MSATSFSRSAPVLSGLPAWEEAEDEIEDEGDEGDIGNKELQEEEEEDDGRPVSFEEARDSLDAMTDWIDFMSRKFSTREADTIYKRLNKLSKFFRPPPAETATEPELVTLHATQTAETAAAQSATTAAPASASSSSAAAAGTTTKSTTTNAASVPPTVSTASTTHAATSTEGVTESKPSDEDWFAQWPSASGLIRANTSQLPLNAQNLIIEYDARLWFHASTDVVRVCPGWVAINVDRSIWGCLDKGWLDYRLAQAGHEGGSDDYMWLKFLRMHRALEVFPAAVTENLYGDFEDMLEGGPSFACDFCPGYKDSTKRCKVCGIEKCSRCAANELYPLHYQGCEHFNEEEELKRDARRKQVAAALQAEEQNLESDDEIESDGEQAAEDGETKEVHDGKTDGKEFKNDGKEAKDEKARDLKDAKMDEDEEDEGDEGDDEGTQIDQLD